MSTPLTAITFTVQPGATATDNVQAIVLDENNLPAPEVYSANLVDTADWVKLTPLTGSTPFAVAVTVDAGNRPDGLYQTQLTATTSPVVSSIELPKVTMTIKAMPVPPPIPPDTMPPIVTINPLRWVGKKVTIAANAWGGAQYMEILIDNELRTTASGESITMLWSTASLKTKVHVIEAHAYDAAGNQGLAKLTVTLP